MTLATFDDGEDAINIAVVWAPPTADCRRFSRFPCTYPLRGSRFCFSLIELRLSWISVRTVGITPMVSITMPRKTTRFTCPKATWDYRSTIDKILFLLVIAPITRGRLVATARRNVSKMTVVRDHRAKKIHYYVTETTANNVPMPTPVSPVSLLPSLYTPSSKDLR